MYPAKLALGAVLLLLVVKGSIVEGQLKATIFASGHYVGEGFCGKEEVPLEVTCLVRYPNIKELVLLPPLVEWYIHPVNGSEFLKLNADPNHSTAHYVDICKVADNNTYECKYEHDHTCTPKFDGRYRCNVTIEDISGQVTYLSDTTYVFDQYYHAEPIPDCFMPRVSAFRGRLLNDSAIFLDWDTTTIPSGKVYCDRSRRFNVRVFVYDTFRDYLDKNPSHVSPFDATAKRRETNFTLPFNATYSVNQFYVFQVRNQHIRGLEGSYLHIYDKKFFRSEVFFFGEQISLNLVSPVLQVEKRLILQGSLQEIACTAVGFPPPIVTMWYDDNLIEPRRPNVQVQSVSTEKIITPSFAGRYTCSAVGYYISPNGGYFTHSRVKYIDIQVYQEDPTSEILCTTSTSSKCHRFFDGKSVWVNITQQNNNFEVRVGDMVDALGRKASNSSGLAERCLEAAQAVVCHTSYPFCFNNTSYRKVCKTTCDLFRRGGACSPVIDAAGVSSDIRDVILSNCDDRVDSAGDFPECIHVPFNDTPHSPSWCTTGRGENYSGHVSITSSGHLCQNWDSQKPHPHPIYSGTAINGARNQCRNPEGRGTRPWCYSSRRDIRWEYCDDIPKCNVCLPYTETFCSSLQGYGQNALVYLNRHESQWGRRALDGAELWMIAEWYQLRVTQYNLSSTCLLYLKEFICHRTVPLCSQDSALKTCSDHCKASKLFRSCPGNLISKLEEAMMLETRTFSELECNLDTKENPDSCLTSQALALATDHLATVDRTCYEVQDGGQSYNGTMSKTISGQTCEPWGSLLSPEAKNYCRNPGKVTTRPWCYIYNSTWEHCDIPKCKKHAVTESLIATAIVGLSSFAISMVVFFIVLGISIILCGIFIAVGVLYLRKRKMRKRSIRKINPVNTKWDYVRNTMYAKVESPSKESKLKKAIESFPLVDKSSVHYIRQLGQGNFGVVFYAKAECIVPDEKLTEVAVKTLKEESCTEALEDFVHEAKLMFSFDHENIVKIYGVSTESIPYYLIFEYMNKGDLAHFLRDNASSAQRRYMALHDGRPRSRTESSQSNEPPALSSDQLRDICKQIASGMMYLAEKNHIHRDLACRNCLVRAGDQEQTESGLVIKIGDFGMSHNLYSADYYRVKGSAILPVRWMSPEAIIYGKFSTESDVWSFGVVMWEVFSFAMQPYYGTSNEEVTEAIRRHKILKQPADCSSSMYEIMKQCWNLRASLRPTFEELYTQLDEFRASLSSGDSHSIDYFNSNSSDLDSDAFLEENSVDGVDGAL